MINISNPNRALKSDTRQRERHGHVNVLLRIFHKQLLQLDEINLMSVVTKKPSTSNFMLENSFGLVLSASIKNFTQEEKTALKECVK